MISLIEKYKKSDLDANDLEHEGWSCDFCRRKFRVMCPKLNCCFNDCLEQFVWEGYRISEKNLEELEEINE